MPLPQGGPTHWTRQGWTHHRRLVDPRVTEMGIDFDSKNIKPGHLNAANAKDMSRLDVFEEFFP